MSDDDLFRTAHPNGMHHLPTSTPWPFAPRSIVYRRYTYEWDPGSEWFQFKYEDTTRIQTPDLLGFLRDLKAGTADLSHKLVWPPKQQPKTPLDILLPQKEQCYVVIELDPGKNWQFRSGGPGVTTKANYGGDNHGLGHFHLGLPTEANVEVLPAYAPGVCGSTIAAFGVAHRQPWERQEFNIHIEMFHQDQRFDTPMQVILDPDIPDDGGGIPILTI